MRNKQIRNEQYNKYVNLVTPKNSCLKNCVNAFLCGGMVCTAGQAMTNLFKMMGVDKETSGLYTTICLVLISVILTGFGAYSVITVWGGAGALVPITGFANGVASPAIEFKAEGHVFGIGCKIFKIAGPVILYGVLTSWILGIIYWISAYLWIGG